MICGERGTHGKEIPTSRILVRKAEEMRPPRKYSRRWNTIEMSIKK